MINDFTSDEKVELHRLNVRMEIAPTKHLLELASLDDGPPFCPGSRVTWIWNIVKPAPLLLFREGVCIVIVQIQRCEVFFAIEVLRQQTADGEGLAAFGPVGLHFRLWALYTWWISTGNLKEWTQKKSSLLKVFNWKALRTLTSKKAAQFSNSEFNKNVFINLILVGTDSHADQVPIIFGVYINSVQEY